MEKNKKLLILLFLVFIFPFFTSAATLYFSPSLGSYSVGSIIPVGVYVSTPTEAMNAASGIIDFPADKLEITSLSKTGSIFSLWVQEPSFSNISGTASFEGIVFNPGFTGSAGKIMTLNFRVKQAGISNLIFSSGSILANDGNGTNILSNSGTAQFTLNEVKKEQPKQEVEEPEEEVKTIKPGIPLAPKIISSTHPDSSKWYNENNVSISWETGEDITGVKTLLNKNSSSIPNVLYESAISEKELKDLEDGIWYFHVQLRNASGWGDIGHFRIQIDTKAPEKFTIDLIDGKEAEIPQPKIGFKTTDSLSGIDYYNIKVGNDLVIKISESELNNGVYTMPILYPGDKTLLVQAFDKAGNYSSAAEEFTIKPLETPIITDYPQEFTSGEVLVIKGKTSYPSIKANIYFEKNKEIVLTGTVTTDSLGDFYFTHEDKMNDGVYKVWAEVVDNKGLKSFPSESIIIIVKKSDFIKISSKVIEILAVAIPLIILLISLIFIIYKSYYRFVSIRKRVKKELIEAEKTMKEALDLLKDDLNDQIELLGKVKSKRELTKEEEKIIKKLKKDVDYLEKSMKKEIEDIKKEIK